jgi:major type 1 subunit fimbrin (pilin)
MKMKKTILGLSLLAAMSASSAYAESTGTINFNGELTDTTCDVNIEGQGPDATITLPTVSINELTAAGQTTGRTSFNMALTNCQVTAADEENGVAAGPSKVSAFFQPGDTVDLSTGRLLNQTADGATNVDLQLLDASNAYAAINVGNTSQVNDTAYVDIDTATGTAEIPYAVEYYATDATTAGKVTSSVVYNLQYK